MGQGGSEKTCLAVLTHCPPERAGVLEDLLYHDRMKNKTYVVKRPRGGVKQARLRYEIVSGQGDLSLARVQLETGRTHQIRAHLAYLGHPVLGDIKYGNRKMNERCGQKTQALCAYRLSFLQIPPENTLSRLSGLVVKLPEPVILQLYESLTSPNAKG